MQYTEKNYHHKLTTKITDFKNHKRKIKQRQNFAQTIHKLAICCQGNTQTTLARKQFYNRGEFKRSLQKKRKEKSRNGSFLSAHPSDL